MSTLLEAPKPEKSAADTARVALKVSAYEHVASWLLAFLAILGAAVIVLLFAWLSSRVYAPQKAVPVVLEEIGGGVETGFGTEGMEIDAPTVSPVAQEGGATGSQFAEVVEAMTTAVDVTSAASDALSLVDPNETLRGGSSRGTGNQPARGTGGGSGGGSGSGMGVPRGQRWEIRFQDAGSVANYARQLDFFGVELAVVGAGDEVYYASSLSKPKPVQRVGKRSEETRLYMSWRRGALQDVDRELLKKAGINSDGKVVLQFLPPQVEQQLALLEKQFRNLEPKQIRQTRFGVRPANRGFEFYVLDQSVF